MVIPPNPLGLAIRPQAIQCARGGSRSQRRSASRRTNVREEPADAAQLDLQHKAYVAELRSLLVERMKLEDCQILYTLVPVSHYIIVHYYYILVLHYYSID